MNIEQLEHYAPYLALVFIFFWQNNIFVKPEDLEKKHREILDDIEDKIEDKYVEKNAYKEFQRHIYSKLDELIQSNNEMKAVIMKRREGDS